MKKSAGRFFLIAGAILLGLLFCALWQREAKPIMEAAAQAKLPGTMGAATQGKTTGEMEAAAQAKLPDMLEAATQGERRKIALTFDDGPHPYYTEDLLDGLKERGVHATFFVIGAHAELHPDVIRRMQKEGHLIGNHTYSHLQYTPRNREIFKEELMKTNEILKEITGEEVEYVRPPYGSWDKEFERELNMIPVLWNIDPLDWCSDNAAAVTARVVENARENGIILMHDYYPSSVTAALFVVDQLQEEGYEFVTVDEILFE